MAGDTISKKYDSIFLRLKKLFYQIREDISKVGSASVLPFIPRSSQRIVIPQRRDQFLSSDHTNYCIVFPHEVLHLSLNIGVMFEDILKVLLTVYQILFQFGVLSGKILVNDSDFLTVMPDLIQILTLFSNIFLYFFYIN